MNKNLRKAKRKYLKYNIRHSNKLDFLYRTYGILPFGTSFQFSFLIDKKIFVWEFLMILLVILLSKQPPQRNLINQNLSKLAPLILYNISYFAPIQTYNSFWPLCDYKNWSLWLIRGETKIRVCSEVIIREGGILAQEKLI